jgi:hypothetical protein
VSASHVQVSNLVMRGRSIALAISSCFALAYVSLLALAAAKDRAILDFYSQIVWLFSAAVIFALTGIIAGIIFACFSFRASRLPWAFGLWALLIVALGIGLVLNAG